MQRRRRFHVEVAAKDVAGKVQIPANDTSLLIRHAEIVGSNLWFHLKMLNFKKKIRFSGEIIDQNQIDLEKIDRYSWTRKLDQYSRIWKSCMGIYSLGKNWSASIFSKIPISFFICPPRALSRAKRPSGTVSLRPVSCCNRCACWRCRPRSRCRPGQMPSLGLEKSRFFDQNDRQFEFAKLVKFLCPQNAAKRVNKKGSIKLGQ